MGGEIIQHKLDRVRSPRVHITYDVETGGAIQMKELPFVLGVLSDLSGMPKDPLPKLKDRKFVDISRDNFNKVLEAISPRLAYKVENTLEGNDTQISVELNFKHIDHFEPGQVVAQVPPLKAMLERRNQLKELLAKTDGNDELCEGLLKNISQPENLAKLAGDLGITSSKEEINDAEKGEPS